MQYLLHSQIYLKKFTVERTVFNYRVYCHSDSCKCEKSQVINYIGIKMKSLRIKEEQEEKIRQLAVLVNKKLIQLGMEPLKDSEVAHRLLNEAIGRSYVTTDGQLIVKNK